MGELTLSGGHFGDARIPEAPSSRFERVVHGGTFGGVALGANPPSPAGASGDFDFVLIDDLVEFGRPCEYQPRESGPFMLPHGAIFRAPHQAIDPGTGEVTSVQPTAGVRGLEMPAEWDEDDLVVCEDALGRTRLWRVLDAQPDSGPGVRLMLHEVPA